MPWSIEWTGFQRARVNDRNVGRQESTGRPGAKPALEFSRRARPDTFSPGGAARAFDETIAARASAQPIAIRSAGALLMGVRYLNAGGQPVILLHGASSDHRIWESFAKDLHGRGYDVWVPNLRGRGPSELHSEILDFARDNYGYDATVAEDVPAIVAHVFAATGKKVDLVGYSFGGMVSKLYVSGVTRNASGRMAVSLDERIDRAGKVRSLVTVGSPVDPSAWPAWLRGLINVAARASVAADVHIPGLPFDLLRDTARVVSQGYRSRDGFDYVEAQRGYTHVPTLMVVGGNDALAGEGSTLLENAAARAHPEMAVIENANHFNYLTREQSAKILAHRVSDFLSDPKNAPLGGNAPTEHLANPATSWLDQVDIFLP